MELILEPDFKTNRSDPFTPSLIHSPIEENKLFQILVCFLVLNDLVIELNKILFSSLTMLKQRK